MSTLTIDANNNITAYTTAEEASQSDATEGVVHFDSPATLNKISIDWPLSRFVEIWNGIPGQSPVKKFQDRKKAVARVWAAIQPLTASGQPEEAAAKPDVPGKAGKPGKKPKPAKKAPGKHSADKASDRSNKKAEVIAMMKRAKGVTLAEIMEATQWQKHTVRGFVSILGSKGGYAIESAKNSAGERTYKITK